MTKKLEVRIHNGVPARLMTEAEGYVMVCHKDATPFLMKKTEWEGLPLAEPGVGADISGRVLKAPT